MLEANPTAQQLYESICTHLQQKCLTHNLWQRIAILTVAEGSHSRIMLLRDFNEPSQTLTCYTDIRSQKIEEIKRLPAIEWLIFDQQSAIQVRITTDATIHHQNSVTERLWITVPEISRKNYASILAPGSELSGANFEMALDPDLAYSHFAVITGKIEVIDILQLSSDRNRRAKLKKQDGQWQLTWLVP